MDEDLTGRKSKLILGLSALAGLLIPGLQRFYLGQKYWGIGYLVLGLASLFSFFPLPLLLVGYLVRLLCVVEGIWVLTQSNEEFDSRFNRQFQKLDWTSASQRESTLPEYHLQKALQEGIITQAEYEQQRQRQEETP